MGSIDGAFELLAIMDIMSNSSHATRVVHLRRYIQRDIMFCHERQLEQCGVERAECGNKRGEIVLVMSLSSDVPMKHGDHNAGPTHTV
jgi:hypothetical protein